mmetsp:Transcript_7997/g.8028  ORF Transcript_7997/g.8028 Transcript_7997/m.8028 type:complete len:143 (+) Transcript_7997:44-472(+)
MSENLSVLERVKMFLPQIEKANADLEKEIVIHGKDKFVIDKDLIDDGKKEPLIVEKEANLIEIEEEIIEVNVTDEIDGDDDDDNEDDDSNNDSQQIKQQIELNFALGDFTDSAIALAEEAMKGESNALDNKAENEDVDDNDE